MSEKKSGMALALDDVKAEMVRARERKTYSGKDWSAAMLMCGAAAWVAYQKQEGVAPSTPEGTQEVINGLLSLVMSAALDYINHEEGTHMTLGRVVPLTPEQGDQIEGIIGGPRADDKIH